MKNASVRVPHSWNHHPPCHPDRSEAKRRDLRFNGPLVEMFFDGAQRGSGMRPSGAPTSAVQQALSEANDQPPIVSRRYLLPTRESIRYNL